MYRFSLFLVFFIVSSTDGIGKCDLSSPPPSWLSTNGTGISDWAFAGVPTNGSSFCYQGDINTKTIQVDYHIDLGNTQQEPKIVERPSFSASTSQNMCVNNSTRIVYCFALCLNETLQNMVIESALTSNRASDVALDIQNTVNLKNWAISVIQVDYNDPNAHLNASSFLDPDVWCSVYVGMSKKLSFDYLFEIQLGKIIV